MSSGRISWGKVIAGAAIAAGAIAVVAFNADVILDFLKDAFQWVTGSVDTAAIDAAKTAAQNVGTLEAGQETLGAALEVSKGLGTTAGMIADPDLAAQAIKASADATTAFEAAKVAIEPTLTAAQASATELAKAAAENNTSLFGTLAEHPLAAAGAAAGVGGLIAAYTHHRDQDHKGKEEIEEEQSFTAREDMRRMQALMLARMQAQGYQPAMAANGMGR